MTQPRVTPAADRVVTFETVAGATPVEGTTISTQFRSEYGISFRYSNGKLPRIARFGPPQTAFVGYNQIGDTLIPGYEREIGRFFLTDDENIDVPAAPLIITYDWPVRAAGGMILDIDGQSGNREQWTLVAYNQSDEPVTTTVLTAGDPLTGHAMATPWTIGPLAYPMIQSIRITYTGNRSRDQVGFAMDNFSPSTPFTYDDSQRIVFSYKQNESDRFDLWSVRPDRTGFKNLTSTTNLIEHQPAISPDGTRVAFFRDNPQDLPHSAICVMPIEGTTAPRVLVWRSDFQFNRIDGPIWMDDRWLAFTVGPEGGRSIYKVDAITGATPILIALMSDVFGPEGADGVVTDISPNRTKFVVAARGQTGGSYDLYVLNVDGTNPRLLYGDSPDVYSDGTAKWSPDGRKIAFTHNYTADETTSTQYLGVVYADPYSSGTIGGANGITGLTELTTRSQHMIVQDWSPDGREVLLFNAIRYGAPDDMRALQGDLWIMRADGQNGSRLTFLNGWFRSGDLQVNLAAWGTQNSPAAVRGKWELLP